MARPKGAPKTGGRQKGTPNAINARSEAAVAATGETPKEYMLRVMRDGTVEHGRRDAMAKAVAPYVHPHLTATEVTGAGGGPVQVVIKGDDASLV